MEVLMTRPVETQNVIFRPNPGPQTDFLAASEREVLYGGAAGGGKSYAILADPLRYMAHPQFSGLILRHTTEELRELIWKSQELYPKIYPGIKWSERKMSWEAPSGARLWMSYLDRDEDVMRYQGLSFCVAESTPVAMADGSFKNIEDISINDLVETIEGANKVSYLSAPLLKECVKVSVYSLEGHLLSEQIQPCSHPIALLSEEPSLSLSDLCHTSEQFQQSPLLWRSYTQLQSVLKESLVASSSEEGDQSCYKEFVNDSQETQQHLPLFYPVVLHEQVLQSGLNRAAIQNHSVCKSLQLSLDLCLKTSETSLGLEKQGAPVQLCSCHSTALHLHVCGDGLDVLTEKQTTGDCPANCSACFRQCDAQLPLNQASGQCFSQKQDDVVQQDHGCHSCGGKGCTPSHIRYQQEQYAHPYTKEQRDLRVPLVLGIVRIEPLENPLVKVRDITVDVANNYITLGGLVNQNCYIAFDELTQWATPFAYDYMRSRLRTTATDLPVFFRSTTNPGGVGHQWVKKMFIDPAPANKSFWATNIETGTPLIFPKGHARDGEPLFKRRFIPAKLSDNPSLAASGDYEMMLLSLPEHQRKQLLDGNWDIAEGAAFSEFNRAIHVVDPFDIPRDWPRFRSCDYGYSSFSAVLWFAVAPDDSIVVYRELYVSKMIPEDLANKVLQLEANESIRYGVLDSSCWHRRGEGPSIAEKMIMKGCRWRPADRSAGSRVAGKMEIHRRLQVDPVTEEPRVVFFNNCTQIISDLPTLPLDKTNSEDINTKVSNDHAYDALRYGLMSRPRSGLFDYNPLTQKSGMKVADSTFGY